MEYNFKDIEKKWQEKWIADHTYKTKIDPEKPKYYVLDMFPYPSGAGLHVGHPLGYIASDIFTRYKRLKGFNVLHPMGYDAYGLPAEQYAIQTGQHPAITTEQNIERYREQLDKIGFSFDWSREVRTSDPDYYKWTQWAFIKMFESYYCNQAQQARPIAELVEVFERQGTECLDLAQTEPLRFTAEEWKGFSERRKQEVLMNYRIAYLAETTVNWCEKLGTVLANDEVQDGLSIRGGHPVVQKKMMQWSLRISAYAERLLEGLDRIDWSDSLKETQRNWIGKSQGAEMVFEIAGENPTPEKTDENSGSTLPTRDMYPTPTLPTREGVSVALDKNTYGVGKFKPTTTPEKWKQLIDITKEYRHNQTEAEELLWQELRNKKIDYKIRRQHIVDGYIADFINLEKRLIIEIDGGIHLTKEQREKDALRTEILNEAGFEVIRFTNNEVKQSTQKVIAKIKEKLDSIPSLGEISPLSCGEGQGERSITVFTTRPDTIYGVTFMVLAPESEYVPMLTSEEQKEAVAEYIERTQKRTERERISDKKVTGVPLGSYAINPISKKKIPIYISDYVLAGYGTGAIMAVPAHDSRDYAFAKTFNLPILPLVEGANVDEESFDAKEGVMMNSPKETSYDNQLNLNGLTIQEAIEEAKRYIEVNGIGKVKTNYRLRDAIFSRQRYWGEPFPIYYKDDMPYAVSEEDLPIELPQVDKFLPTETGEPPLGRAKDWTYKGYRLELSTMPGFAGSSAYYLRYQDPRNSEALVSREANDYWGNVDLYLGGAEHATGHLIYSRFWNKFLFDYRVVSKDEPFQKLINQGMIQGRSNFVYRIKNTNKFVSYNLKDEYDTTEIHVDVNIVDNDVLDLKRFREWMPEFADAEFILEDDGKYRCGWAVEKMSKSMFNVVNPDDIIERYGADTLRLYEMFLGPIEQSKPWDTNGIDGVHRFLRKLWGLIYKDGELLINDQEPTAEELKTLHKTIKKITFDIENFSFNTSVSAFMICVNELTAMKCSKRAIIEPLSIILAPFTPHIAEEIYHLCGNTATVCDAKFPEVEEKYLVESSVKYPISFNGKVRFTLELPADMSPKDVEAEALSHPDTQKWLDGKSVKKVIIVPKKIVNVVVG